MSVKRREPLTDDEKYQVQIQAESELGRFQRQYMLLDRDRSELAAGTSRKLVQQKHILSIFRNEYNNILTDLGVASAKAKKRDDQKTMNKLETQLDEYDRYKRRVKKQKTSINEVEDQIKTVKKDVLKLESLQVTDRQQEERIKKSLTTLETLENKLEVQIKKFCGICYENKQKRDLINHFMIERQDFLKFWNHLINNLQEGKKYMLDLIEQATIAYDEREEWCSKLQALRVKAQSDFMQHTTEMREYKRREDNNVKLEEFFATKGQKRVMHILKENQIIGRECQRRKMERDLRHYRKLYESILNFCEKDSYQVIGKQFVRQEEENFMFFNYVNGLIGEMEVVNDRLGFLHLDIDERKITHEIQDEQQKLRLEDLEKQLEEATQKRHNSEKELKILNENLARILQGITNLYKICGCSKDPFLNLLGHHTNIHYYNVELHLEILEKRVFELLLRAHHNDKILIEKKKITSEEKILKDELVEPQIYPIVDLVKSNPCPLCVEHEMVSDVIDVLQIPLTRDEVKEKLKLRLGLPDGLARVHNVSACQLPKSRQIIQKRYQ